MVKKKQAKPKNTKCYTEAEYFSEWKCPYCRKYNNSYVSEEFPQQEEVKCKHCERTVLITEEE